VLCFATTAHAQFNDPLWSDVFDEGYAYDVAANDGLVFAAGVRNYDYYDNYGTFIARAYDAETGTVRWMDDYYRESPELLNAANAVAADGTRVFAAGVTETTAGGKAFTVRAYDTTTGDLLWDSYYDREGALWDEAYAIAVSGGLVFAAGVTETAANGKSLTVLAYNATTGTLLWSKFYDRERGPLLDEAYAIAASGSQVFAAGVTETAARGKAFTVRAYNAANGTVLWTKRVDREGSGWDEADAIGVSGDTVIAAGMTETAATGRDFTTIAFDAANLGAQLWADYYDGQGNDGQWYQDTARAIAISGVTAYVAGYSFEPYSFDPWWEYYCEMVRAYNTVSGTIMWTSRSEAGLQDEDEWANDIVVSGDTVCTTGVFAVLDGEDFFSCKSLWC